MARIQTSEHLSHSLFPTCHLLSTLIHLFIFFLLSMGLWKQMTDVLKVIRGKKKNSYPSLFLCSNSLEKAWRTRMCRWRDRWQDWSSEANKIHRQHLHVPVYQEVLVNYKGISTTQEDLLKNKSYLEDLGFHVLYAAGTCLYLTKKETLQSQVL